MSTSSAAADPRTFNAYTVLSQEMVEVASRYRTNVQDKQGNYTFRLPASIQHQHIQSFDVEAIEVPNSMYSFRTGRDTIVIEVVTGLIGAGTYTITVTAGNYDPTQLVTELNAKLTFLLGGAYITALISPITGKLTLQADGSNVATFKVISVDQPATLVKEEYRDGRWGFSYQQLTNPSVGPSVTSANPVVLSTPNVLYLCIKELGEYNAGNKINPAIIKNGLVASNIIARVQNDAPMSDWSFFRYPGWNGRTYVTSSAASASLLSVQWYDEFGEIVDFNGVDHSFLLRVVFKPNQRSGGPTAIA